MPDLRSSGPHAALPEAVRAYGHYFLVRKLAEGGMAEIFLAKQMGAEGFERNVVIKRMLAHLSSVPDFVGMFLDEARLAARLAHPNIVQINDLGQAEGCYYICMEYHPGEDFSTILRTASRRHEYVPLSVVTRVVIEAAQGLHFAHEFTDESGRPLNIVHRDISPSNIYVTYQGQAKLLDFGIAKAESRVTQTTAGVVKGKYMYMAPEQAGNGVVDRRADVFSLGVTLYEGLTNRRPFARDTDLAILNAVLKGDFKRPRDVRPDLPPDLESIVLKAMAQHKEERYPNCAELGSALEGYLLASSTAGGGQVSVYLRSLFGEARVAEKTRIPTLASLAHSGVDVPGFANPKSPPTAPETAAEPSTQTAHGSTARSSTQVPALRRSPLPLIGTAVVGLLAGVGALWAWNHYRSDGDDRRPTVSPPPLPATMVVAPPAADSGSRQPLDAGRVEEPPPARPDAGAHSPPAVHLTPEQVQKYILKQYVRVMQCFNQHKADLQSDSGRVFVLLTIEPSGRASDVKLEGPVADTAVGKCLVKQVGQMTFPRNLEHGLRLKQALDYRVTR
jgi:serine/threonine protein kinase